ncbi:basic secretory protein-like protein [Ohtaekwangia kribbensis]|jgi:hypothetical protein|uniref:Basic secretory protein-like protein n=1 Tax=Ohtaekwangia kribbensis TaxID=688913 RepID=A0ABW3KC26_9BACT
MKRKIILCFLLIMSSATSYLFSQHTETIRKRGYILTVINHDKTFDPKVRERMIKTFFDVYPVLMKAYNAKAAKEITFEIDTAYNGVAEASGTHVRYNPKWFHTNPGDIDVVTHEIMHIVQNYPGDAGPWWITEGVADYVRYVYGVDNAGGGWALPPYINGQHYSNGYRVTARFLVWMEKQVKPGIVKTLDRAMRTATYTDAIWQQETGKNIDQLWTSYTENPIVARN